MGKTTESKHIYDQIAKIYFESNGYEVKINGSGPYPDLTARKNNVPAIIEVKGPEEKGADDEYTYENKIGDMSRPEISDLLFDAVIDKKTIRKYTGLTKLYCFGIISELYHYYKAEKIKHPDSFHKVEAFFCIPGESKNIVAMTLALILLKGTGFIHEDSALHGEYTEQKNKIQIFKIIFNEDINKKEAEKNIERHKEEIQRKVEKEISKTKNKNNRLSEINKSANGSILQVIKSFIGTILSAIKSAIVSVSSAIGAFFGNPFVLKILIIVFVVITIGWLAYKCYPFGMGMKQQQVATVQKEITLPVVIPAIEKEPKTITVWFGFDSSELSNSTKEDLDKIFTETQGNVNQKIIIEGHTCTMGADEYNRGLSLKRAEAVKSNMVRDSDYAMEIITVGYSSGKPIENNNTKDGRAKNRRVEIYIQPKEKM